MFVTTRARASKLGEPQTDISEATQFAFDDSMFSGGGKARKSRGQKRREKKATSQGKSDGDGAPMDSGQKGKSFAELQRMDEICKNSGCGLRPNLKRQKISL